MIFVIYLLKYSKLIQNTNVSSCIVKNRKIIVLYVLKINIKSFKKQLCTIKKDKKK